jgi:AICAR transformylase/IMP cyclohydrolase PurH
MEISSRYVTLVTRTETWEILTQKVVEEEKITELYTAMKSCRKSDNNQLVFDKGAKSI